MKTFEQIADEVVGEVVNPNTSNRESLDTRTLLVMTAALAITAIEGLDNETVTDDDLVRGMGI